MRTIRWLVIIFLLGGLLPLRLASAAPLPEPVASYTIRARLDPVEKTISATQVIEYQNTSNSEIPDLVFHLYLNAFRNLDSLFMQETGGSHRGFSWDPGEPGWINVTALRIVNGEVLELREIEDGTLARAELPEPLAGGETLEIEMEFNLRLPRVFARTGWAFDGRGDPFFMVGQWFPKLGVWEEGGWNAYPFYSNSEFYADFGTYAVDLTVPDGYILGGTGMPVGEEKNGDGTHTVRYEAENVIDFAWTASPNFQAYSQSVGGIELHYLYLPEHAWTLERVSASARTAVEAYNTWYGQYPYPRLTLVDVPEQGNAAGGMEYPTLVTLGAASLLGIGETTTRAGLDTSLEAVTIHEIGHQWWQSMVAFNEAEEPWLDEGLTDYSTTRVMERYYATQPLVNIGDLELSYFDSRRLEYLLVPNVPMAGKAWEFSAINYGISTYSKPVLALTTLERMLGDEIMLAILSTFFERYQYAHPGEAEFRQVAEEVSGKDLTWFFDGLVYGTGSVNYRVDELFADAVALDRQGDLAVPVEVLVEFVGGQTVLEQWDGAEANKSFSYPNYPPVRSVQIDPDRKVVVDLVWSDNGLTRNPDLWSWASLVTRLVYQLQSWLMNLGGL